MTSSLLERELDVRATSVAVTDDIVTVELADGRTLIVPTMWYPRLRHATSQERENFEIGPFGIEWPEIEADFSIRGLLLGQKSGESAESVQFWLDARRAGRKATVEEFLKLKRLGRHSEM